MRRALPVLAVDLRGPVPCAARPAHLAFSDPRGPERVVAGLVERVPALAEQALLVVVGQGGVEIVVQPCGLFDRLCPLEEASVVVVVDGY